MAKRAISFLTVGGLVVALCISSEPAQAQYPGDLLGAAAAGAAIAAGAAGPGYFFGGRQYCWYDNAWSGPGWYWCGYAWRSGYGWGGGYGWNGWRRGYHGGGGHGGHGWHGGHGDHHH